MNRVESGFAKYRFWKRKINFKTTQTWKLGWWCLLDDNTWTGISLNRWCKMSSIANLMGFGQSNSLTGGVYTLDLSISSAWFLVALLILPIKFVMLIMCHSNCWQGSCIGTNSVNFNRSRSVNKVRAWSTRRLRDFCLTMLAGRLVRWHGTPIALRCIVVASRLAASGRPNGCLLGIAQLQQARIGDSAGRACDALHLVAGRSASSPFLRLIYDPRLSPAEQCAMRSESVDFVQFVWSTRSRPPRTKRDSAHSKTSTRYSWIVLLGSTLVSCWCTIVSRIWQETYFAITGKPKIKVGRDQYYEILPR